MKRIFVGIMASEKLKGLVEDWRFDKKDWPVRWVGTDNLHLTLVPPFCSDRADDLIEKLESVREFARPSVINFKSISYGPVPSAYRLIWVNGDPTSELSDLKKAVEDSIGARVERRDFRPHLTLARFQPEYYRRLPVKNLDEQINWTEEIKSFELIESILSPSGAEYKVLKSFQLQN